MTERTDSDTIRMMTGTLDTSGYGEGSLREVALVYQTPGGLPPQDNDIPAADPEPVPDPGPQQTPDDSGAEQVHGLQDDPDGAQRDPQSPDTGSDGQPPEPVQDGPVDQEPGPDMPAEPEPEAGPGPDDDGDGGEPPAPVPAAPVDPGPSPDKGSSSRSPADGGRTGARRGKAAGQ